MCIKFSLLHLSMRNLAKKISPHNIFSFFFSCKQLTSNTTTLMILPSFLHVCLFLQNFGIGGRSYSSTKSHFVYLLLQPIYHSPWWLSCSMCCWWFLQNLSYVCFHSKWRLFSCIYLIHGMCFNPFMIDWWIDSNRWQIEIDLESICS